MQTFPAALRTAQSVATLVGADNSLESINTSRFSDRALVTVALNNSIYMLRKDSVAAESLPDVVAPKQGGPGRWVIYSGGAGGDFEPFDNSYYFDPQYVASGENGSIAGPFTTWAQWVALLGTSDAIKVNFPGYPVTPGAAVITEAQQLVIEGVHGSQLASYINSAIELGGNGSTFSTTFRYMSLEAIGLRQSQAALTFEHCEVNDITVLSGVFTGTIRGFDSQFLIGQVTPDAPVILDGGYVTSWSALTFDLTNVTVGTPDLASPGTLTVKDTRVNCRDVTFAPGSTIVFAFDPGVVNLDPASYRSFLDNSITITNGVVVRDDGSFPINAATYPGVGEVDIDWFANPRAYIEQTDGIALTFLPPLTRELVLIVDNQTSGEGFEVFTWPIDCRFAGGVAPVQVEGLSLYKIEYEEQLGVYIVWAAVLNALPEGI